MCVRRGVMGGWRGVSVSRFLPAQERRRDVGFRGIATGLVTYYARIVAVVYTIVATLSYRTAD